MQMPRGRMQRNRTGSETWHLIEGGAGGVVVANPDQLGSCIARALVRRFLELQWKEGRLTAPFWQKRPRRAEYERLRNEALTASAKEPHSDSWMLFQAAYPASKSDILRVAAKEWGISYSTLHRLVHG